MTINDKLSAGARSVVQILVDKEPVNYIEAGSLYGIVITARVHVATLNRFYNHAQDQDLKDLIKESIDTLSEAVIRECEDLLEAGGAKIPTARYQEEPLDDRLDIPSAARFNDEEIAMTLVAMDGTSQLALLVAMRQSYQLEIARALRTQLDTAIDWSYRLLQLMIHKGWLPEIAKVEH